MNEIPRHLVLRATLFFVAVLTISTQGSRSAQACFVGTGITFDEPRLLDERWRGNPHPLVGKAWASNGMVWPAPTGTCQQNPLTDVMTWAVRTIWGGGILLLGEVHDNADHHLLRAGLLAGNESAPAPAVVFEHIRADQRPALDQFAAGDAKANNSGTADDLFRALEWSKSGWPDQIIFEPLMTKAIRAKLPILPGEPARDAVRKVAREGESAVSAEERTRLKLDVPLEPPLQDALLTELEGSHCGMMPKTAFGNMAFAQRYRDAYMADAVLKAQVANKSAILLAGNGHVRRDRGVPWYLHKMAPQVKILSVLLLEVEEGKTDPQAYGVRDADGQPIADFVVFTPRQERPDPCEKMREAMKAKKG